MIQTRPSYSPWVSQTITGLTRSTIAVGLPVYFLSRIYFPQKTPGAPLLTASLVILSSPSTLLCALGAIEGVVRSCGKMFAYCNNSQNEQAHHHWDQFSKEVMTTHGLMRGTLSPVSGYTIIVNEWNKQGPVSAKGSPRVLKEEYLVYYTLRALGRALNHAINQIKTGILSIKDGVIKVIQAVWDLVTPVIIKIAELLIEGIKYLWKTTQPIRDLAIKCVNAIKWVIWDFTVKTVMIKWICTEIIWPLVKFIFQEIIWNIGIQLVLRKAIWPPVRFTFQWIIWPPLKFGAHIVSSIVKAALNLITWTTRQIYKGGS